MDLYTSLMLNLTNKNVLSPASCWWHVPIHQWVFIRVAITCSPTIIIRYIYRYVMIYHHCQGWSKRRRYNGGKLGRYTVQVRWLIDPPFGISDWCEINPSFHLSILVKNGIPRSWIIIPYFEKMKGRIINSCYSGSNLDYHLVI